MTVLAQSPYTRAMASRLKATVIAILFLFALLLSACSGSIESFPSVVNQGILALSTDNPYSGANLFLAKESEFSSYLFNFLEQRGAPTALEVLDERFESPRVLLFYPKDKEVWVCYRHSGSKTEWVVNGPFAIQRHDYRELGRMATSMVGEPVFIVFGQNHRFKSRVKGKRSPILRPTLPAVPLPSPTPLPAKKRPVIKKPATPSPENTAAPGFTPLNTDQMAILMAQGFAERNALGDAIHTVRSEKEDFDALVEWYTGSKENAKEIRGVNGLAESAHLSKGMRITIPLRLLKNTKAYKAAEPKPAATQSGTPQPATSHH